MFKNTMICPWWAGALLSNPIRRLIHDPEKITAPYIPEGGMILEIGPGAGFFTLEMADIAGDSGRIYCVDIQEKMLSALRKRSLKAGLSGRIITRKSTADSFNIYDLYNKIDFCLLFAVAHEIPDKKKLFYEIHHSLKKNGLLLFSEPAVHVTKNQFNISTRIAIDSGFRIKDKPVIRWEHSVLLIK